MYVVNGRFWCLLLLAFTLTVTALHAQPRPVPADGRIVIVEPGCRDWGPDLVHYSVDTKRLPPGKLALLDAQGNVVPFQIDKDVLCFVAAVKKGQTATFTLSAADKDRSAENSTLAVRQDGAEIEASNEFLSVRMPAVGEKAFPEPADAAAVPTPILRWRQKGFDWMGAARFAAKRKVVSYTFTVLHNGPACFEYEARYRFAPEGEYVWRVRIVPQVPFARVTEEMDSGKLLENNQDFLLLELHKGWQPTQIEYVQQSGETEMSTGVYPFDKHLEARKKAAFEVSAFGGTGQPEPPAMPEKDLFLLDRNVPAGKWGGLKGGVRVAAGPDKTAQGVAVVPLHVGEWRRTMALNAWGKDGAGVLVGLPLDTRWMWWQYDCADDQSPFSSHEHDESLKSSYSRRVWALYFGPDPHTIQPRFGAIGLDRFKDWITEWPEDKAKSAYPRAYFTPEIVAETKAVLDQHPDKDVLSTFYVISGNPADAARHAERFLGWIKNQPQWYIGGLSHYRQAQMLMDAYMAEDALACPELPAQPRTEIRRWLALWAYLMSDGDFNPRGAGVHLGNPNMPINRTIGLAAFAPLLPDHPRYAYWMNQLKEFVRFKLATHSGPDGVWLECPNYQLYGPMRYLDSALNILRNTGVADPARAGYYDAVMLYTAQLTAPDVRFNGLRILPGMGNSGDIPESIFGLGMRAASPELRPYLRVMHRLSVGPNGVAKLPANHAYYAFNFMPAVKEEPRVLKTTFMPTYGVIFRNHYGTPGETQLMFRAGINWSHWDTDIYNVIVYGKGAPLSPGTGYGYGPGSISANNAIYHNRVKLVKHDQKEIFGRVDAPVRDYGFGDSADYAMGDRYYPPELYEDGKERHWRRHVLFLKSAQPDGPTYAVMRDTFPGNPKTDASWWTWLNLGEADRIAVDGKPFDPKQTPRDAVPDLSKLPELKGNAVEMKTEFGAGTLIWFAGAPLACRARVTFSAGMHLPFDAKLPMLDFSKYLKNKSETKTVFEAMAAPGADYFYAVYPHKDAERPAEFKQLADGCIKIVTPESNDYAFVSDAPLAFDQEDVVFTGKAGAVRVYADRVALCLNAGTGRVGYKGCILEGSGPFERVVELADLKPGVQKIADTYEKKYVSVNIGQDILVEGEGPFEARVDGETIRIKTTGRARVLNVTRPKFILKPQYWIDGKQWMACWTDWPDSGFGRWSRVRMLALSVPDGEHELVVKNLVCPPVWERTFTPGIGGVVRE